MAQRFKFFMTVCVLLSALMLGAQADPSPEPEPARARTKVRASMLEEDSEHFFAEARQADEILPNKKADDDVYDGANNAPVKDDASSGRLFLKKFLLFRNLFNSNTQPVIPIIITGPGTGTGTATTNPTTTVTSTGTIPTATGTITTAPATGGRFDEEDGAENEDIGPINEQALQAALAAGAQEYVVTDGEIQGTGTGDGKATKQPNRINLKRQGSKKGKIISVRIPPRYRQYFSNGQKVMLNTKKRAGNRQGNRPGKRRVVKKRINTRRGNKNKRRRVVPGV